MSEYETALKAEKDKTLTIEEQLRIANERNLMQTELIQNLKKRIPRQVSKSQRFCPANPYYAIIGKNSFQLNNHEDSLDSLPVVTALSEHNDGNTLDTFGFTLSDG